MNRPTPPDIVILGGGSAGWITACLMQKQWGAQGTRITVVESPEIGIIGVGEGSTPQLKAFFDHLGIAESDWMPACDATYKLGIRFTGWSEREGFGSYFHPFPSPVDLHTEPAFIRNCGAARQGFDVNAHPDDYFLAAQLAELGKAPHPNENFPFEPSYGYHFDAHKLGAFMRDFAVSKGVIHKAAKVEHVEQSETGDIAALLCQNGDRVTGDIFVDCSGFRSLLAQQTLQASFKSFGENLFNDRAVVMPTMSQNAYQPQTVATAMRAGWRWSIPLTTRVGNGYVYSSAHISDDEAETELRQAIGMLGSSVEARVLRMNVGRVEDSWTRNCLAAGLAQGFIEPLEATALHIVIVTTLEFMQALEAGQFTPQHRDQFNANTAARYEGIRDYIVGHYRLNQRSDTEYWRANAANQSLSDGLKAMMTAWFTHQDIAACNGANYQQQYYSSASWHCLFAGYGTFPAKHKKRPAPQQVGAANMDQVNKTLAACITHFPSIARTCATDAQR